MEKILGWKYLDQHVGPVYVYESHYRPISAIGINYIPAFLMEPGSDPDGTKLTCKTYKPIPKEVMERFYLHLIAEYTKS